MEQTVNHPISIQEYRLQMTRGLLEDGPFLAPEKYRRILRNYLSYLENQLTGPDVSADIGQLQEILLEVSELIRSGKVQFFADDYRNVVRRLVQIYGSGFSAEGKEAFAITAVDYADVIEAISRVFPDCDYSEPVGQLLYYMNQLFKIRKSSWMTVYEHIRSMPDSIEIVQRLKQDYFQEIQDWAEQGVANLFEIHKDLHLQMAQFDQELEQLNRKIIKRQESMTPYHGPSHHGEKKVVHLAGRKHKLEMDALLETQDQLTVDRESKAEIAELIESNILEFESKLKETRRAFFIRLVWNAPVSAETQSR
jgi:hypothetical protein